MTTLKAFGWIPVPLEYTDDMPAEYGGYTTWRIIPVIKIRPKYSNDVGLHQHELGHCEQMWMTGIIGHVLAYKFSKTYRRDAEVECYRRQIACYPVGTSIEFAVNALVNKYDLGITAEEARELLGD